MKKAVRNKEVVVPPENGNGGSHSVKGMRAPTIRKSKLLIVDLAGSERVDKSGCFTVLLFIFHGYHASLRRYAFFRAMWLRALLFLDFFSF